MFMKNGIILSIADRIKDALPIPTDEFRKRLEEDCYVTILYPANHPVLHHSRLY